MTYIFFSSSFNQILDWSLCGEYGSVRIRPLVFTDTGICYQNSTRFKDIHNIGAKRLDFYRFFTYFVCCAHRISPPSSRSAKIRFRLTIMVGSWVHQKWTRFAILAFEETISLAFPSLQQLCSVEGDGEVVNLDVPGHGVDSQHTRAGPRLTSQPVQLDTALAQFSLLF